MRKLVLVILALFALFTLINAYTEVTGDNPAGAPTEDSTAIHEVVPSKS